jgi:hypothetical protein
MLLDRVKRAAGILGTIGIVFHGEFGVMLIQQVLGHPGQKSILADHEVQEIASIVIFRHPDLTPCDVHIIPIAHCLDPRRGAIKPRLRHGQADILNDHGLDITNDI